MVQLFVFFYYTNYLKFDLFYSCTCNCIFVYPPPRSSTVPLSIRRVSAPCIQSVMTAAAAAALFLGRFEGA